MIAFDAADLYLHKTIESLDGAPDQDGLVFIATHADQRRDCYRSAVWYLRPSGFDCPRRLTSLSFDARSPSLAPDGRSLAFISTRDPQQGAQLHVLPIGGGEASCLTCLESVPQKIQMWSADGDALLVTLRSAYAEDEFDQPGAGKSRPRVADFLPYKSDGGGYRVGFRIQLHRIHARNGESTTLIAGDFDVLEAQWSPDGERLAFVRNRSQSQRQRGDLWLADGDGGNARRVIQDFAIVSGVRWSPDGRRLAFAGARHEGDALTQLWLFDPDTRQVSPATEANLQLEGQSILWHPSGERIATVIARRGLHEIAVIDLATGKLTRMRGGLRQVKALCAVRDRLVFVAASLRRLEEIESMRWNGDDRRRHSAFNAGWFSERERPRAIKRRFDVPDGDGGSEKIDAWLLLPPHREGPFPLLVDMHAGPQSVTRIDFAAHVYWYALCAKGWAILAPNAVGSASYGTDFAERLIGRWGELDMPQHLAIVDTLRREGMADHRLACAGQSYGGFLAAWAIGHSEQFSAAVISAPVANIESHAGSSDTGYFVTPYMMGGEATERERDYHQRSPIRTCRFAETATLILQGENDQRCPLGQAEELFTCLVRCAHAPCKLVVYPNANHNLAAAGLPSQRLDYHRRLIAWLERWTADAGAVEESAGSRRRQPAQVER